MDKLHLHEKFTKENFLNLCSLRWSEWGRWRRFFVIAGAIAAIVVSAPSFVMILPCVTVFYLISCTVKNAVEIVSNWKWGPIFPKKRIKKDEILTEIEEGEIKGAREKINNKKIDQSDDEVEDGEDYFLDSLESINGDESGEEVFDGEAEDTESGEDEEFELPESSSSENEEIFADEDDDSFDEDLLLDVDTLEETEKSSKNSKRKELR